MQKSNMPAKFLAPFAQGDTSRVEIPYTTTDATRASQFAGFPPLTMQPPEAGGVPPQGEDFNGAMNQVARVAWWVLLGSSFPFDSTFATNAAINGYPSGAVLQRADGTGFWLNTADNVTVDPDVTTGTASTAWVPAWVYGNASIAISTTTTPYPTVAAKPTLTLTGTLTANSTLNLPAWVYEWLIIDNTVRGGFTLTAKTTAGTGVVLASGAQRVRGDGTNIVQSAESIQQATLGTQPITLAQANSLYAPLNGAGAPVQGAYRKLAGSATGTSAAMAYTVDELVTGDGTGNTQTLRSWSVSVSVAAAAGPGGIDTGTSAANTWYAVWAISKPDGTKNAVFSLNFAQPSLANATGYTRWAYLGAFRTDSTVNKFPLACKQFGGRTQYAPAAGTNLTGLPQMATGAAGSTTAPTWSAVAIGTFVPTTAVKIAGVVGTAGGTAQVMAAPNNQYGAINSAVNPPPVGVNFTATSAMFEFVVESANIYYAASAANAIMTCLGWEDNQL